MPSWRRRRPSRLSTVAASDTSSAEVGSSHSRTSGGTTVARAERDTLTLAARQLARLRVRDLREQADEARARRRPAPRASFACSPSSRRRSPTSSPTVSHGVSDAPGVLEHHLRARAAPRARSRPGRSAPARRSPAAASTCRSRSRRRARPTPPSGTDKAHAAQRLERAASCEARPRSRNVLCTSSTITASGPPRVRHRPIGHSRLDLPGVGLGLALVGVHARDRRQRTPGRRAAAARSCTRRSRAGTAARTRSPSAGSRGSGGSPSSDGQRPAADRRACAAGIAADRVCTGASGPCSTCVRRAQLRDPPCVHHRDAVGDLRRDPEVVRDEARTCNRSRRAARGRSARICACTVTSSAVVGSSAITSAGRPRSPSRSSPAGAARPRARAGSSFMRRAGSGMPTDVEERERRVRRARRFDRPGDRSASSGSATSSDPGTPRRVRRDGPPAPRFASASVMSTPCTTALPVDRRRGRGRQQAEQRQTEHALARARLPDEPEDLAARERQVDTAHRVHVRVSSPERHVQVAQLRDDRCVGSDSEPALG